MKLLNYFLILFISISIVSCGSDDDSPSFNLSIANLAGTYEMTTYESGAVRAVVDGGNTTELSSTTSEGDSFDDVELSFTGNNFTLTGSYRLVIETETSDGTTDDTEIIIYDDESGTFSLDLDDETITLNSGSLEGEYDVDTFTSTRLVLSQEDVEIEGNITETTTKTITFER